MYKLNLTYNERRAIDFCGDRYFCGDDLFKVLTKYHINAAEDWREKKDITFELPEYAAWEIKEFIDLDTDELKTNFPLFGAELSKKLITFYEEII